MINKLLVKLQSFLFNLTVEGYAYSTIFPLFFYPKDDITSANVY